MVKRSSTATSRKAYPIGAMPWNRFPKRTSKHCIQGSWIPCKGRSCNRRGRPRQEWISTDWTSSPRLSGSTATTRTSCCRSRTQGHRNIGDMQHFDYVSEFSCINISVRYHRTEIPSARSTRSLYLSRLRRPRVPS